MKTFVGTELLTPADASSARLSIGHYRDNDKREFDFMVDDQDTGGCVGVDVEASNSALPASVLWNTDRVASR